MIVTDRFVFIHLHRTGGRFVRSVLMRVYPNAKEIGYHFPLGVLPKAYNHLPVIGFIRNPWDWYLSWYAFNYEKVRNPIFSVVSQNGALSFEPTIRNLLSLRNNGGVGERMMDEIINRLPKGLLGNRGAGITKSDFIAYCSQAEGYYSWLVRRMFDNRFHPNIYLGKFEALREGLLQILVDMGVEINVDTERLILNSPPMHGGRKDSINYVGDELELEIADTEAWICRNFNYELKVAIDLGIP